MKILFVSPSFPDRNKPTTGYPNYLYRVSLSLIEYGHKPYILSAGYKNDRWTDRGIEIIRVSDNSIKFDNSNFNELARPLAESYVLNKKIKRLDSKVKFDIVQFTSLDGVSLLYNGKIPAVMRLSSYAKTYFSTFQTLSPEIVKIASFVQRLASRRCNAVYAPCRVTAEAFGNDIGRKVYTIENPFVEDVVDYDMSYYNTYLKRKKYVLFFGTLYAEKGIKVIGNCLYEFLDKNKDYYFVFAGGSGFIDGENSIKFLTKKAGEYKDRIVFTYELPHSQLYPVIKGSDFVVLPSLMDNLPNACIEAMYFGKVVIGTDGASFEQLITHKVSGLLCKIGDSDDLLDKIEDAVAMEQNERDKIGMNAKKRIDQMKPEIAVKRLIKFYNKVIKISRREV
jgi:glycosyltransferase involved in cell wall biosynthesis